MPSGPNLTGCNRGTDRGSGRSIPRRAFMSRYTTVIGDSTDDETNRERADHSGAHLTVRVEGAGGGV